MESSNEIEDSTKMETSNEIEDSTEMESSDDVEMEHTTESEMEESKQGEEEEDVEIEHTTERESSKQGEEEKDVEIQKVASSNPSSPPPPPPPPPPSPHPSFAMVSWLNESRSKGIEVFLKAEEDRVILPLVGNKEALSSLLTDFLPGCSVIQENIKLLDKEYASVRRVRRDGNSFYRSFIFSYVEQVIEMPDATEIYRFLERLEQHKLAYLSRGGNEDVFKNHISFCQEEVIPMGVECDLLQVAALSWALNVPIRLVQLDVPPPPGSRCLIHIEFEDSNSSSAGSNEINGGGDTSNPLSAAAGEDVKDSHTSSPTDDPTINPPSPSTSDDRQVPLVILLSSPVGYDILYPD
ncbi:uncharacterized protein [Typha angustifolia]|uniref:uncharacterized protein n=1 Tax=Typha angustifolia TaxID=59011 RepID=UPI003C2B402E